MPEPEPGPARKQLVQRAEGDLAQLSDRPPLHTAKADTPDRHDGLAQCCSGQRRLGSRSHRPAAVLGHGLKFRQHFVDKGIDVGKRIPRTWRGLCGTDGSSHSRASMLVLTVISSDCHRLGHHLQLDHKLQSASHQLAHASYKQILSSIDAALAYARAGADVVQLEKFTPEATAQVVSAIASLSHRPLLVAAGGVNATNAAAYATAGADVLATSAPYAAPPRDVQVTLSRAAGS